MAAVKNPELNKGNKQIDKYPVEVFGELGTEERQRKLVRNSVLKRRYGIDYTDYLFLLNSQNSVCQICKQPETTYDARKKDEPRTLAVDHDHETGEVRGLLCSSCNIALGKFRDNVDYLKSAIEYLEKSDDIHTT